MSTTLDLSLKLGSVRPKTQIRCGPSRLMVRSKISIGTWNPLTRVRDPESTPRSSPFERHDSHSNTRELGCLPYVGNFGDGVKRFSVPNSNRGQDLWKDLGIFIRPTSVRSTPGNYSSSTPTLRWNERKRNRVFLDPLKDHHRLKKGKIIRQNPNIPLFLLMYNTTLQKKVNIDKERWKSLERR